MGDNKKVVILGAGPAGLSAAFDLSRNGYHLTLIDRAPYLGGASASFKIKDYIVDYGPHAFHIKNDGIVKIVEDLVGDDCVIVKRNSRLILDGKNLQYPLDVREVFLKVNPLLSFRILRDYASVKIGKFLNRGCRTINSFEDWGIDAFGHTLYRLAFGSYSEKMWGLPGRQLAKELAQQKLLKLDLKRLLLKAFGFGDSTMEGGVTKYHDLYPRFGIGTVFENMAKMILRQGGNRICLGTQILSIDTKDDTACAVQVRSSGRNETIDADYVISSIPLKYLAAYLLHDNSNMVRDIGNALKYRDIRVIYIILDKEYYSNVHWFYLLDPHFKFNRMSEQKNLNQESSPPGRTVISLDISCQRGDHLWNMPDEQLFQLALDDLRHMGIEKSHILDYFSLKLEDVYPIYSLGFGKDFNNCIQALKRFRNVFSTGRQGLFLNNDIHDSMEMGILAGTFIRSGRESCEWYAYISKYIRERLQGNIA